MDAILIAGGIPAPDEPLYKYTQGLPKAMVDVAGKAMIQWVLDALGKTQHVENIILIGLPEDNTLKCAKPLHYVENQGSMLANIVAGIYKVLEINPQAEYVISVSSDIPAITGEMIDWLIDSAMQTRHDIYYGIVTREVMEARYPGANRTFTKLADMHVCGADMHIAHKSMVTDPEHLAMWDELIGKRKSPLKQAASIGFVTLFLLLTGKLSLNGAIERITKRLNITGRAIQWDYAEPAMDVDKPHQLELLRADMERRLDA
ncbi:MAG: NTP transferase domain-containing protein [Chloroflexi bacterium]|jgi:GTP:adenosylcobinamide-phosphate guanylyltransferase|nr:NTP transferase domain-containing protein [Chloroflexota bacterium]